MALIDADELEKAYREDRVYALQLEVGDICRQGCLYCYMNALPFQKNALSGEKIVEIVDDAGRLGVTAIEWLGGEPLLRPGIFDYMARVTDRGMQNNIWTGGLPLADSTILDQARRHARHGLIAIHVSSVDPATYRRLHPDRPVGDLALILTAVEELLGQGYPAEQVLNSVTLTGLQSAGDMIATIDHFEQRLGVRTCVNVYHTYLRPGQTSAHLARFIPDKRTVAKVYRRYARQHGVREFPMNCVNKQYCSATMAVLADGSVTPCATIREESAPSVNTDGRLIDIFLRHREHLVFQHFKNEENLPHECRVCNLSDVCWGCRSRSFASGVGMYGRDPRCFRERRVRAGKALPSQEASGRD